jgi:hypothetical protein
MPENNTVVRKDLFYEWDIVWKGFGLKIILGV